MLSNIPAELRALPQWVAVDMSINAETGQPWKRPIDPKTNYFANVVDSKTWGTFEQAVSLGRPVGFVFTKNDPYAIIDLDNKPHKPATPNQLEVHNQILTGVESYIERSISKTGYHVVIKGSIPHGVNFGNVELYSDGRYMIFTGDVIKALPIEDYNEAINNMHMQITEAQLKNKQPSVELHQVDGFIEDGDVFAMGSDAVNGDKFNNLCRGDWQHYGFPSQSEADLALMSMFTFYSKDNDQCRRLFRMTALGKREKYQTNNNHLDRILTIVRAKEPQPVDLEHMDAQVAHVMTQIESPQNVTTLSEPITPKLPDQYINPPKLDILTPPGILSMMADYIYMVSPRQVREYAVCAAISMLAGISARAYNVSRTGLNQYMIVLGGTGTGKEGMASGIGMLEAAINDGIINPTPIIIGKPASAQGLHKSLITQPCGLSILGEVGNEFKIMLSPKADPNSLAIKTAYLDLYNKSGDKKVYYAVNYSKAENNMTAINSPNLSILGETVPDIFYSSVNESSAIGGFLARLTVMEYSGIRKDYNDCNDKPSQALVNGLAAIRNHSVDLQARNLVEHIQITPDADIILKAYDKAITKRMNDNQISGVDALLNRSHVKALKLAGLGAVAINYTNPVITQPLAEWAIAFVNKADSVLTTRFESGEVGEASDVQFESIIRKCITNYFKIEPKSRISQKQPVSLAETNFISYSYISSYCKMREPFKSHKLGYSKAIEIAIKDLVDVGVLVPVPVSQLPKANNGHLMKAYIIGNQF